LGVDISELRGLSSVLVKLLYPLPRRSSDHALGRIAHTFVLVAAGFVVPVAFASRSYRVGS
jgi:hypothetical protein